MQLKADLSMNEAYQLAGVEFFYGKTRALCLPNLSIPARKIIALMGENGSGKSTLLNLLAFLKPPTLGKIYFCGVQPKRKHEAELRKNISFLTQKPYLFRGSVSDNLKLPLKLHGIDKKLWSAKVNKILENLQIQHLAAQPAQQLSGGEMQKVALARALITEPQILLMDEPFSYLDQGSSTLLEQFIFDYAQQRQCSLIFSTHNRLQGLSMADEIICLADGKLA